MIAKCGSNWLLKKVMDNYDQEHMPRIIVTGGAGFIGSSVQESWLAQING